MFEVRMDRFEELVRDALDDLPGELVVQMENVAVFVEDQGDDPYMLGFYEGIPLTQREGYGTYGTMPDRITIYRRSVLAICRSEQDVVDQVRTTVLHEVAHHFGIDDERLGELGWA